MALADFLDHKCDIYHLIQSKDSPGYGLPDSPVFNYNNKPDEKEIPCHFGIESLDAETEQKQPQNILRENIRINDRIVDCNSGLEYTAERPRNIRGHHIFVYIKRIKEQEAL